MPLRPGARLGPYEVLGLIGAGGMGEVYRAWDSRLERDVALKVLPAEALGDETARARLVREARLASQLNHPHICTIHDVGETDASPQAGSEPGAAYIAMELVEGQPLSARVAEGPLPIDQVLQYGRQLADALTHAHRRGVVHRDLKSANVMVTPEGHVKVLDFGLAKRLTGEDLAETTGSRQSLTATGVVAGTLAYMAPEQLLGRLADARSDIWALGVVLYEMAAGRRPFQGQTGFELTSAILKEPLPPLPPAVPATLQVVVGRCMAKEPGERYQGGSEVKAALEAVASGGEAARWPTWRAVAWSRRRLLGGATAALALVIIAAMLVGLDVGGVRSRFIGGAAGPRHAIRLAVLPFANLSGDPEQEPLADGITEQTIAQLGSLHPETLSVIGRTSVMRYKKGDRPIDQIGQELRVDYILEGSAQREANRVRITARLIRVNDQTQVWARPYEHELSGIMMVQSDLAKSVAEALALTLLPAEKDRLASARTVNPEAYEAYVKGSSLWKTLKPADLDAAQRHFEQALVKDPSYAPAYAGLSWVWGARGFPVRAAPVSETGPKAKAAALQALALDGNSSEAHEALAAVRTWADWDWAGAEPEWRRALELNPSAANAHAYYSHFLAQQGRPGEAIQHIERALELDPFNALYHAMHSVVLQYARRFDDALAAARKALSIQPDLGIAFSQFQYVYMSKGMRDEQLADQKLRIARDPERHAAFKRGFAEGGYEGAQRALADVYAARYEKGTYNQAEGVALRYLDAGDKDRAIDWLYKSYADHDPQVTYIGRPHYDPLRSDPRFQALLRRIGLPQ